MSVTQQMLLAAKDSYTKLLLHCDGADASTTFYDYSAYAKAVTANGNAQIDTAQAKFGSGSFLSDNSGDFLSLADSDDWNLGNGNFTIDFWVRANAYTAVAGNALFTHYGDANNYVEMWMNTTPRPRFKVVSGGSTLIDLTASSGTFGTAAWIHIAIDRSGDTFTIFKDGASVGSTTASITLPNPSGLFYVGFGFWINSGSSYWDGWIDEFRLSKGISRYGGAGFTPPTVPYP